MQTQRTSQTRRTAFSIMQARFLLVSAVLLAGCVTGERPTLTSEPTDSAATNDPVIDTVLDRLALAEGLTFTATYTITPTSTGVATDATVRQLGDQRRVTIGDVDFLTDTTGASQTCDVIDSTCVGYLDDAMISNLSITHRFWGDSFADRLKLDASRNLRGAAGQAETIAGFPASCADVTVVGGTLRYCALDAGVLARYIGADVKIELTSFSAEVDPLQLTR